MDGATVLPEVVGAAANRPASSSSGRSGTGRAVSSTPADQSGGVSGKHKSLMDELPPNPPSPYRPQMHKPTSSVLPSLFQSKLETRRLRDENVRLMRQAAEAAEEEVRKSNQPIKKTLGKDRRAKEEAAAAEPAAKAAEEAPQSGGESSACDEAMREFYFFETQRNQVVRAESDMRDEIEASMELAFTKLMLEHFDELARAVMATELSEAERPSAETVMKTLDSELQQEREARAQERQQLLERIAVETASRLAEERLRQHLAAECARLLPEHDIGRKEIIGEEAEALLAVFRWEKENRPFGAGAIASGPKEDPRMRYYKKKKRSSRHKPTLTERTIEDLRARPDTDAVGVPIENPPTCGVLVLYENNDEGALVPLDYVPLTNVDPPDSTPEGYFVEDGKRSFTRDKSARHEALRKARATAELLCSEENSRSAIQHDQAKAYVPILLDFVDGMYAAKRLARVREEANAAFLAMSMEEHLARIEAKARALVDEFYETPLASKEALSTVYPHSEFDGCSPEDIEATGGEEEMEEGNDAVVTAAAAAENKEEAEEMESSIGSHPDIPLSDPSAVVGAVKDGLRNSVSMVGISMKVHPGERLSMTNTEDFATTDALEDGADAAASETGASKEEDGICDGIGDIDA